MSKTSESNEAGDIAGRKGSKSPGPSDAEPRDPAGIPGARHRLLRTLSQALANPPGGDLHGVMVAQLEQLAALAGVERASLSIRDATGRMVSTYRWGAEGFPAPPVRDDRRAEFPWAKRIFDAGEIIQIKNPACLPEEARLEREAIEGNPEFQSLLVLPLMAGEIIQGAILLESLVEERGWSEAEILEISIAADCFANALERERITEAGRADDERFHALTGIAVELIAVLDDEGRYCYLSPSSQQLLGQPMEELIGVSAASLLHPDDAPETTRIFLDAMDSGTEGVSHRYPAHRMRHKDGSWRWFELSGRAYRTSSGARRYISIGRDVSERFEMEQEIAQQRLIERRVSELSRALFDLPQGEIEEGVRAALRNAAQLAHADRSYLISWVRDARSTLEVFEWSPPGVEPYDYAAAEHGKSEIREGRVLHIPSVCELPDSERAHREELSARGVRSMVAIPILHRDALIGVIGFESLDREVSWTAHEIETLRVIGELFTSAVRRHRTEASLRESESQLMQAQKMEALGTLAGGIAHDFNNLLTVILGFATTLLDDFDESDPAHDDLAEICDAAERAAALTRQLLTFSRPKHTTRRRVHLGELVAGFEPMLRRLLGENIDFRVDGSNDLPCVEGDPHQYEQVIMNLVVNARDAMPEGGEIHVTTSSLRLEEEEARQIGLTQPGDYVVMRVSDTGEGMDREVLSHIFDPFFTTKESSRGSGLGLAVVYGILEKAGGTITVDSERGRGTVCHVFLPRSEGSAEVESERPEVESHGDGHCILLVEDEESLRRITKRALESGGHRVLEAGSGNEALAVAASFPEAIHLLISDVVMPRMSGPELSRKIRLERPEIEVLFISGHPESMDGSGPVELSERLLHKPFRKQELLAEVSRVLPEDEKRSD